MTTALRALGLATLLAATGCSSRPAPATPPAPRRTASAPSSHGIQGAGFAQQNVPFEEMVARARAQGHPAILYFCATWCGWCQKMNRETLPDARVQARLREFPTSLYDPNTPAGRAVADRYEVRAYPTMVLVDGSGQELDRIKGASSVEDFLARLSQY